MTRLISVILGAILLTQSLARADEPARAIPLVATEQPPAPRLLLLRAARYRNWGATMTVVGAVGAATAVVGVIGMETGFGCSTSGAVGLSGLACLSEAYAAAVLVGAGIGQAVIGLTIGVPLLVKSASLQREALAGHIALVPTFGPSGSRGAAFSYAVEF